MKKALFGLSMCVLVGGCFSSGPSEAEVRDAMRTVLVESHTRCKEATRGKCPLTVDGIVNSFKLIGCKDASGEGGYQCDMTWDSPSAFGDDILKRQFRVYKVEGKWKVEY